MEALTFERLPEAVNQLFEKLDRIEKMMSKQQPGSSTTTDDLMTVAQAAKFLDLTIPTIYSKTSKGELPYMKRGKRVYFSREDLIKHLKKGKQEVAADIEPENFLGRR